MHDSVSKNENSEAGNSRHIYIEKKINKPTFEMLLGSGYLCLLYNFPKPYFTFRTNSPQSQSRRFYIKGRGQVKVLILFALHFTPIARTWSW